MACAQQSPGWWPFGGDTGSAQSPGETAQATPVADPPQYLDEATDQTDDGWPNIHLPEIHWRPLWSRPGAPQPGVLNGPVNRVRAAGRNSVDSARNAWNTTVDKFKWSGQEQPQQRQVASGAEQPGLFERLFGPKPDESDGPRTVVEWMAQERPGMSR
jgi:hypothetical protein